MLLRWVGFFFLVIVVHRVLTWVPVLGPFLGRFGIFGFWISAIVAGWGLRWLAARGVETRRYGAQVRELEAVDSARNKGKLGSLLAQDGRLKRALPLLREAHAEEPESAEWAFQLGRAALREGEVAEALDALRRCVEINEEHGYGQALMRLVEARLKASEFAAALEDLERFERNHGENPESAYRSGEALRGLGRKEEARTAFQRVGELARSVPKYQRAEARAWALRARFASV